MVTATKLDSHADSTVVGTNSIILGHTGKIEDVSGFTDKLGKALKVPVVHVTVVYDCNITRDTKILVSHHVLYLEEIDENLIPW